MHYLDLADKKANSSGYSNTYFLLFKQLRPKQWTKNLLVFAALLFSYEMINYYSLFNTVVCFFLFSFISGCVYIVNDYLDIEADRQHPIKKNRPMASGALSPKLALVFGASVLIISLTVAFFLSHLLMFLLILYFVLNVFYSIKLKHVVIIDVMIIASGFVLRAIGGGLVINVPFTPWFLLCTMLLSLFLAIGKRRHELILLTDNKTSHRKVLEKYSIQLLDQMNNIVATSTIICYSLFTFTSGKTVHLMWTIPLVIYGVFRYLYLIHIEEAGGAPDKVLYEDKHILITVILFGASVAFILAFLK
ncbi:decaprenyl-phosphate phosphoribosyltransferase [Paenibacillus oleatilyticus]|uniref:decaprenyl-phosphate phosphoribosyltransferase n=1 Tax=Paenibacillus oleatilyticus TaxID=2594886 RepID=UPI001C1F4443|nr:decaprenyl-phosphate phosphoribosyltransferase [Paenibacillus oleatilyticus]MBU7319742.1 decaprenyl-phosphate phosphoribosyltransferase [Paenibacillus oleatilyticus]